MADSAPPETETFVRLHSQSHPRVFSYILSLVPNRADAADIMQETSVVLWQKFGEFEPDSNFATWACRIAHFKVLEFRRRSGRDKLLFDADLLQMVAAESLVRGEQSGRHNALQFCLAKLPSHDHDLIERRYREGAKIKDVADQVGRPVDAVYKSVRRIMQGLLACIERHINREARP